jgi:hypothetical protein
VVRVETFSRDVSSAVRGALDALPAGVRLENPEEQEESTGARHRVELYAPVHEYSLLLSGHTVKSAAAPPTNQGVRWPSAIKVASCWQNASNQKRPECCVWTMSRVRRDPLIGFNLGHRLERTARDALESGYPHRLGEEGRPCVRMRREPTF